MKTFHIVCLIVGLFALNPVRGEWYFEIGPFYRGGMDVEVKGGSRAAETGAQIARPGTRGTAPRVSRARDDGAAQIFRQFDDGFVGPSGTPLFFSQGQTQFFGFQNDAQHDAGAGTLTFTRTHNGTLETTQTTTRLTSSGGSWKDSGDLEGLGLLARAGFLVLEEDSWDLSAQLQLGWLGGLDRSLRTRNAFQQEMRSTVRVFGQSASTEFVYDTFHNPFFPSGPYAMNDPTGVGPLISDTPLAVRATGDSEATSSRVTGSHQVVAHSRVELQTEADLFVLGMGPRFHADVSDELSLFVQGGGSLNLLDTRLRRQETFETESGQLIGQWRDRSDEQKWLWGASLSIGVLWALNDQMTLSAAGGYEWVERTTLSIGPDQVKYDLGGYQIELTLGWVFGGPPE